MTKIWPTACAGLALVAALAGCGVQPSRQVTVYTLPAPARATTPPRPSAPASQPPVAPPSGTTAVPPHTGPGPAFTHPISPATELQSAVAKLRTLGFAPLSTATYDPNQTLRVLIGARAGAADGHRQQAFFFDGDKYLGTDAAAASGMIAVAGTSDTNVTLRYGVYRPSDLDCCPTGATSTVRFALDGGRLAPLDPIPSAATRR